MFDSLYRLLGEVISFFYNLVPNYGVAIILLTIFVRLVLLPLTIKQTKSMQAMQKIQPHMKELQAKHKGDKQRLNEEMMKLYKEHQVNPLGGCLPLVLQFPVFIALFRVLNACGATVAKHKPCPAGAIGTKYLPAGSAILTALQTGNTGFLGMKMTLSPAEVLGKSGVVSAFPYLVLLVLMGLTTWYQTKQAAGAQPTGANNQMAIVGKVMPVMLMLFSFRFPVGVSIYWVVSNLWTIGQQRLLLGPMRLAAATATPPGRAPGGGGAGRSGGGAKGGGRPPSSGSSGAGGSSRSRGSGRAKGNGGAKGGPGKGSSPARDGRSSKGPASPRSGGAADGGAKSGNPKAQSGNGRDGASSDGGPAPRSGGAKRPSGGGQARKKRGRR
jgi:YidC/Oxa1 family membrane protein insertase